VSNRTRSKADYTDQNIGSRTRSKMQNINNLNVKKNFFPLHDAILFQGHGKSQAQDLKSSVVECKAYHNVLLNTKYQVDFDRLLQLHLLDNTEEDKDMSWECCKIVDYCKAKEMSTAQITSVCWNGTMSIRLSHGRIILH
jgi:hypothetical protein